MRVIYVFEMFVQSDSKLLSGIPWPIVLKPEIIFKNASGI
jgi:hypothetical protein